MIPMLMKVVMVINRMGIEDNEGMKKNPNKMVITMSIICNNGISNNTSSSSSNNNDNDINNNNNNNNNNNINIINNIYDSNIIFSRFIYILFAIDNRII